MNFRTKLIALIFTLPTICACTDYTDEHINPSPSDKEAITRTFIIDDKESRTAVHDDGTIHFTENEDFYAFVSSTVSGVLKASERKRVNRQPNGNVVLTHDIVNNATSYDYLFISPYPANPAPEIEQDWSRLHITLNSVQNPTTRISGAKTITTFDPTQDILASKRIATTSESATSKPFNTEFKRIFTFFKLIIPKTELAGVIGENDKILEVSVTGAANDVFSGVAWIPITDVFDSCTPTFTTKSNTVIAKYGEGADFTLDNFDVWMVINPTTVNSLKIVIRTTTKTITQYFPTTNIELLPNKINKLTFQWVDDKTTSIDTPARVDYSKGVQINGQDINVMHAQTFTTSISSTEDYEVQARSGGIYFLDNQGSSYKFKVSGSTTIQENLIIVGRYSDHKPSFYPTGAWSLYDTTVGAKVMTVAFKNLKIDLTKIGTGYFLAGRQGAKTVVFEDCEINAGDKALISFYRAAAAATIENIIIKNCKIRYSGTLGPNEDKRVVVTTGVDSSSGYVDIGLLDMETLIFENNIVYGTNSGISLNVFKHERYLSAAKSTFNFKITINNNTFVQCIPIDGGLVDVRRYRSITASKNIFWSNKTQFNPAIIGVRRDYNTDNTWPSYGGITDNLAWGTGGWNRFFTASGYYSPTRDSERITPATKNPLSFTDLTTGVIVKDATAKNYGSTLE